MPTVVAELKRCVVCGARSHRADWQSKEFPACDNHSPADVAAAIAKAQAAKPKPVAQTPTPTPTPVPSKA